MERAVRIIGISLLLSAGLACSDSRNGTGGDSDNHDGRIQGDASSAEGDQGLAGDAPAADANMRDADDSPDAPHPADASTPPIADATHDTQIVDGQTTPPDASGETPTYGLRFVQNAPNAHEYGLQTALPPTFGEKEFTLELWIRPEDDFPVGPVTGDDQLINWSEVDAPPLVGCCWWYSGNFLLDGHNNDLFHEGTFSLQFYGGGRVRWLFGDGVSPGDGDLFSVGPHPATLTPSLIDDNWHHLAVVRRFKTGGGADLELWIDGQLVDTTFTPRRTNMRTFWDNWDTLFPDDQAGWFWGAEKQAAILLLSAYEDYKGDLTDIRFWDVALPSATLADYKRVVANDTPGLVGRILFNEGSGLAAKDARNASRVLELKGPQKPPWVPVSLPQ